MKSPSFSLLLLFLSKSPLLPQNISKIRAAIMKSPSFSLLLLFLSFSLLPLLSSARPCKTLFISYYTVTTTATPISSSDPTSTSSSFSIPSRQTFAVFRVFSLIPRPRQLRPFPVNLRSTTLGQLPVNSDALAASIENRAKDILVVVAGLLFGAGCGAITAATMYIVYALVANRGDFCSYDSDDEEDEQLVESPKKMGYVMIAEPEKEAAAV